MHKSVLKRIVKEFWIPFFLAMGWTAYSIWALGEEWRIIEFVNLFGPSFFLLSWISGQYFRIKKREQDENSFSKVIHHITGGDSRPEVKPIFGDPDSDGTRPLKELRIVIGRPSIVYDLDVVAAEVVYKENSLDRDFLNSDIWNGHSLLQIHIGTVGPSSGRTLIDFIEPIKRTILLEFEMRARNGLFRQRLFLRKENDEPNKRKFSSFEGWVIGLRIFKDEILIYEFIDPKVSVNERSRLTPDYLADDIK
ncbi:MAG: hypothetical protein RLZZ385_2434 [Pseudomonadota bacterium]|jgi:hypothetical protein